MSAGIGQITPPEPLLPIPEEPEAMKATLRVAIGEDPIDGKRLAVEELASVLYAAWVGELTAMGVDERRFSIAISGASNEVWLWVMGDRPFDQLAASLGGRVLRRIA
jgi:hypothetical protein